MKTSKMRHNYEVLVNLQEEWIRTCGGTLQGYISNYTMKHNRPVEEARSIYAADMKELARLQARRDRV